MRMSRLEASDKLKTFLYLFQQLSASINIMGLSSHHIALEGDGFCVPERNVFGSKMYKSIQEQKQASLQKWWQSKGS